MAASDDDCDLDTLSALLEEEDSQEDRTDTDNESSPSGNKTSLPQALMNSVGGGSEGRQKNVAQHVCLKGGTPGEEEEEREERPSAALQQATSLQDASDDITPEVIAAFFNDHSDSDDDFKNVGEDGLAAMSVHKVSAPLNHHKPQPEPDKNSNSAPGQDDPVRVQKLHDELAMMQTRMLEIQQMLASQSAAMTTSAASPQTVTSSTEASKRQQPPKTRVDDRDTEETGFSKVSSSGSSVSAPSPSSLASSSSSSSKCVRTNRSKKIIFPSQHSSTLSTGQSHSVGQGQLVNRSSLGQGHPVDRSWMDTVSSSSDIKSKQSCLNSVSQNSSRNKDAMNSKKMKSRSSGSGEKRETKQTTNNNHKVQSQVGQPAVDIQVEEATHSALKKSGGAKSEQRDVKRLDVKTKHSSTFLSDVASSSCDRATEREARKRVSSREGDSGRACSGRESTVERKSLKRELFGEQDSDSDWENLDGGGDKSALSSAGQDIHKLMSVREERIAHTPSYTLPSTACLSTSWKSKVEAASNQRTSSRPGQIRPSSSNNGSITSKKQSAEEDKNCMTEKFSGLRIKNPKVSSIMIGAKMEGRKMIPVSKLHLKVKSSDLQSDWVTIGVIVQKSDSRKSQTGKTYSIWKLSDLQDSETTVSFFLFGQVYKQLWKMDVGSVIGLLNPSIMDSMEKGNGEVAFTVNNQGQVMAIGQSRDLGWCIGRTKRGATCTNFINKKFGDFCTYHVQAAYRRQSAKRGELHGSCPGTAPKPSLKSKLLQNNTFFYGGETYTASKGRSGVKDKVTLAKLQAQLTQQDERKVNTLSIQNLLPDHKVNLQTRMAGQHQQPFLSLLSMPSTGSMNLVQHMATTEGHTQVQRKGKGTQPNFQSVQASDLLKQHRQHMSQRLHKRSLTQESVGRVGDSETQVKGAGLRGTQPINIKQTDQSRPLSVESDSQSGNSSDGGKGRSKSRTLTHNNSSQSVNTNRAGDQQNSQWERRKNGEIGKGRQGMAEMAAGDTDEAATPSCVPDRPMLAKGFYPGSRINLSLGPSPVRPAHRGKAAEAAKRQAIQRVQSQGGLEKVDPNAIKKKIQNPDLVHKRVLDNIENESLKNKGGTTADHTADSEPPRKRSRLLGNVDPNSAEVKELLTARSSHTGALAQAEAEREERYFDNLEKKEQMEEKMKSVTSMEVTVYTCAQCKYTAMSMGDRCRQEGHSVKRHRGKRRYFACTKCKHRTVSLQRYPNQPCKKCGEQSFEKTSMHQEKAGPKLDSEILCLRGDESKFVNAMDQKVFMATLQVE